MRKGFTDLGTLSNMKSEEEEIWAIVRTWLSVTRIIIFVSVILVTEFSSDYFINDISAGLWSLIFGVPGFLLISALIIFGDKRYAPEEDRKRLEKAEKITSRFEEKRAYLHPIKKRI